MANEKMFDTFTLPNGVTLKNRVMMAPMTNYAAEENGEVSEAELAYYAARSGGVGAVITACANVTADGQGFPNEFGAERDELIPSLKRLATTIQDKGAKAILQIFHAGRMAPPELVGGQTVSASAVAPEREGAMTPRALEAEEVEAIIEAFGQATRRAMEAGFDGVEIHGANTYLIQQFVSPHSNRRDDKWGGSLEKRLAFPLAVVDAVEAVAKQDPSFIVGYRFSPEEIENPGITLADTMQLVDVLAKKDLDYLHVSVMDFFAGSIRDKNETRSPITLVQERVGQQVPVIGVGSLHTPEEVERALTEVPLVALGRELIMEPTWVEKVEAGDVASIRTELDPSTQAELVMPDALWQGIISRPGWFPIKQTTK